MLTKIDSSRHGIDLRELWAYRELLWLYIERDYRIRYKYTLTGIFWYLFQPFFNLFLFYLIFRAIGNVNYGLQDYWTFALTGIILWLQLEHGIQDAFETISGSKEIIKKIYLPILILPLYKTVLNALDTLLLLGLFSVLLYFQGLLHFQPWQFLFFWVVYTIFCLGVNILVYSLLMRFRDARFLVPPVIRIFFLGSAVLYPVTALPTHWQIYLWLNPITSLIQGIRSAFLAYNSLPFEAMLIAVSLSILVFFGGMVFHLLVKDKVIDYL